MLPIAVKVESMIALDRALVPPATAVIVPKLPLGSKASVSGGGFAGSSSTIRPGAVKTAPSIALPPLVASA